MTLQVQIKKLPHAIDIGLPHYATEHSAGMDLLAANREDIIIAANHTALVPTGISIALPPGYEAQIRPRSGLALKHGITVLNSPGTIDADYRGEIGIILINHSNKEFIVKRGMRIAQMIVTSYSRVSWQQVNLLDNTARGAGGFGSTGTGDD